MTDAPARPLRRDARANREQLLTAAREVFAAHGIDGPLEAVARRAGVSIGTLYNRFGGREGLVDAALADLVEESVRSAEAALADPDPWRGLVRHLEAMAAWQAADRGFAEVCTRALPAGSATEVAKERGHELFERLVTRAREAGELRPEVTAGDVGLLTYAAVNATAGIRRSAPEIWRRHLAVVLDGLRPHAAPLPGAPLDPAQVRASMRGC